MNAGRDNNEPRPVPSEENDPLWHLLGRAPMAQPDAWFTVRAQARCHREGCSHGLGLFLGAGLWRWALGGGFGVCLAVGLLVAQVHTENLTINRAVKLNAQPDTKNVQEAFEINASLNSDSESSSSSPWQDSSR